jgi:glutamate N-acetyltransferase/amino-acid N-acetyltransferase
MKHSFTKIGGAVTAPRGFRAAGIAAGIKRSGKKDMTLIVSDEPATVAATFTTNQVKAAPVKLSMRHAKSGRACAIIANSGNANACTG